MANLSKAERLDGIRAARDARQEDDTIKSNGHDREGAALLNDVHAFLGRFIGYPSASAHDAHALWIAHTHLIDSYESTPRLAFLSPEKASGKTRALEITETLVPRPVAAVNVSAAYLFRRIGKEATPPTILFDEIDTVFGAKAKENEELRALLNAGHRRGAKAGRCAVRGKQVFTEELDAFAPVALAGLGWLPDTIMSRSVIIPMRRRAQDEPIEPYRRRLHAPEGEAIRARLAAWAAQAMQSVMSRYPTLPPGIADRDADMWEPLLAVAEAIGSGWPERARASCVSVVSASRGTEASLGVRLLADVKVVFDKVSTEAIFTTDLLASLNELEESPWGDLKGKALNAHGLAKRLRPYGIKRKQVRLGALSNKGYAKEDFHDAWKRYVPQSPKETETSEARKQPTDAELDLIDRAEAEAIREERDEH